MCPFSLSFLWFKTKFLFLSNAGLSPPWPFLYSVLHLLSCQVCFHTMPSLCIISCLPFPHLPRSLSLHLGQWHQHLLSHPIPNPGVALDSSLSTISQHLNHVKKWNHVLWNIAKLSSSPSFPYHNSRLSRWYLSLGLSCFSHRFYITARGMF